MMPRVGCGAIEQKGSTQNLHIAKDSRCDTKFVKQSMLGYSGFFLEPCTSPSLSLGYLDCKNETKDTCLPGQLGSVTEPINIHDNLRQSPVGEGHDSVFQSKGYGNQDTRAEDSVSADPPLSPRK